MTTSSPAYGQVDHDYGRRMATTEPADDGPVWMVNLMRYKAAAEYPRGYEGPAAASGREADDRYAPWDVLAAIGAEVVLVADVESQLLGDDTTWERVAVVRYPTRRSFIDMQARDDFRARHVHKEAGMDRTFVIGCVPAPVPDIVTDGQDLPDWATVPHPPTVDDGEVIVAHVIRYADGGGAEMEHYQRAAAIAALPHGGRIGEWFDVDGTIVGDGRRWDQVRFNRFPSRAAFMAVVTDPGRMDAHAAHRAPAMADTYTLVLRPTLDVLGTRL